MLGVEPRLPPTVCSEFGAEKAWNYLSYRQCASPDKRMLSWKQRSFFLDEKHQAHEISKLPLLMQLFCSGFESCRASLYKRLQQSLRSVATEAVTWKNLLCWELFWIIFYFWNGVNRWWRGLWRLGLPCSISRLTKLSWMGLMELESCHPESPKMRPTTAHIRVT